MLRNLKLAAIWSAFLLGGGLGGWISGAEPDSLTFLSVGQGDCAVFRCHGSAILIDAGPKTPTFDAGEKIVTPKLHAMGLQSVDIIFLTHPDEDHIGGLGAVKRAFPGARVAVSDQFRGFDAMERRLADAGVSDEQVLWLPPESKLRLGSFEMRVDCPRWRPGESDNEGSLFIRLSNDYDSAVLTGDASAQTEAIESGLSNWRAEVLKAGHHGSRSATSEKWLQTVRPKFVVISCGRGNRYGHPDKSVVDRLAADHVTTLRTDELGDVRFEASPGGFRFCPNH